MGYMKHNAIVVTAFSKTHIKPARKKALSLGLSVTPKAESPVNGYYSFLIIPDGSKEDWRESEFGDEQREDWCNWAKKQSDKGIYFDWVHVSFGGDEPSQTEILDHTGSEDLFN